MSLFQSMYTLVYDPAAIHAHTSLCPPLQSMHTLVYAPAAIMHILVYAHSHVILNSKCVFNDTVVLWILPGFVTILPIP